MSKISFGGLVGGFCVVAGLAALGLLAVAPTLIGSGAADASSLMLAGGVFTVALAASLRD